MADYLEELIQRISTRADLKGFDDLDRKQKRAIKANDILATSFKRAFGAFLGIQGIRSIIETSKDFDLLQKSIKGLTGSTEDWEYLRSEADRTGTSLKLIAGAYKNFYSAANMSGFKKGSIQSMFSDVLTAGTGIGASQEQLHSALIALEQMLSKGKVTAQELRLQMGNALPGSFEIAAKAMGMTTQQLDEMMSKGQLMATTFLPKFTKELKNTYQQGFYQNVHSLNAELNRLSNAWQEFQANILQGEAGEALAQLVRDITKILKDEKLLKFIEKLGKALRKVFQILSFIFKNLKLLFILWSVNKVVGLIIVNLPKITAILTTLVGLVQTLALAFSMIISGNLLGGLAILKNALWALNTPILVMIRNMALLVIGVMAAIDAIETLQGKDTVTKTIAEDVAKRADPIDKSGNYKPSTTVVPFAPVVAPTPLNFSKNNKPFKQKVKEFFEFTPPSPEAVRRYKELNTSGYIDANSTQTDTKNNNLSYNPTFYFTGNNLTEDNVIAIIQKDRTNFLNNALIV